MKKIPVIIILLSLLIPAAALDGNRDIALDLHLIIDNSIAFGYIKNDAVPWILEHLIDSLLKDGDTVTIWAASDRAVIVSSGSIGTAQAGSQLVDAASIRRTLLDLEANSRSADFTSALMESSQRFAQNQRTQNRLSLTVMVVASAISMEPVIRLHPQLMRWSRTLHYEGWQVLFVDPHIDNRVQQAAQAYMNSLQ